MRSQDVAMVVIAAAARLVESIQTGVEAHGYTDVRPVHGFAFARIAAGDATTLDLAEHLGVTKQAASQLVQQLVDRGYVARTVDPSDARRHPLTLTRRGRACTREADLAAAEAIARWRGILGADGVNAIGDLLGLLDLSGPVRPAW